MRAALCHVLLGLCACVAAAASGLFDSVALELSYEHYAEPRVLWLPAFLAMPCNCLVNAGYVAVGALWLSRRASPGVDDGERALYVKDVFAAMALAYGPVQWARLATLARVPAVLDQWLTLPIFAWVPVWCRFVARGWRPRDALVLQLCSLGSYALALAHERGFEAALAAHVALAVQQGVALQRRHGDARSRRYLGAALLSCCGFLLLKALDLPLARYRAFRHLTGHFWSKVCDVLQFHYSLCFLTHVTRRARAPSSAPRRERRTQTENIRSGGTDETRGGVCVAGPQ
ncbi:transmembrane protein 187 [Scleropages formosus]|nr:transmembrane protein 187 [Scleropages formosus]